MVYEISGKRILDGLSCSVAAGETLVLLGRSGSGKSTALKLVNGMLLPTSGEVLVNGKSTREWNPVRLKRSIGYVIQDTGLFPHYTVARNIGLVPELEGQPQADIDGRVDELLAVVGLVPADQYRRRYPAQLSGGQRQRVGVARALAASPMLLLFDEPFGALDPVTRTELRRQFSGIQRRDGKSAIFVTHDIREAIDVGDRIALLAQGKLDTLAAANAFRSANTTEARAFLECL